jgi:glucose/arabinose dehydrogenase
LVYAYITASEDNRVVRMRLDGSRLGPSDVLLSGIAKASIHNGGRIAFGPDGFLYVATGDAAERGTAQDRSSLSGKILRLTAQGRPAPGNPFPNSPVWSYGHRNVQGIAWDSRGRMWASEFGQNAFDELNRIEPGRNYGWPEVEGPEERDGFTAPQVAWSTDESSPSGIAVVNDVVYVAGLRGARLWRVPSTANGQAGHRTTSPASSAG